MALCNWRCINPGFLMPVYYFHTGWCPECQESLNRPEPSPIALSHYGIETNRSMLLVYVKNLCKDMIQDGRWGYYCSLVSRFSMTLDWVLPSPPQDMCDDEPDSSELTTTQRARSQGVKDALITYIDNSDFQSQSEPTEPAAASPPRVNGHHLALAPALALTPSRANSATGPRFTSPLANFGYSTDEEGEADDPAYEQPQEHQQEEEDENEDVPLIIRYMANRLARENRQVEEEDHPPFNRNLLNGTH